MSNGRVSLTREGEVAIMRMTRPEAGNAIDPAWIADFDEAVGACAGARAVLIAADGGAFTVGGDLKHFASRSDDLDAALDEMVPRYHAALGALASLPIPVVAALQGPIAGGGIGVASCADIVIASTAVRFVCGFARLGLSGDGGGSWFLPRLVGMRRAQTMMFENRDVSAEEALDWGLVTRVVAPAELDGEALATAHALAAGPPVAFAKMRTLLRESWGATLERQLEAEAEAMVQCGATADAREGVRAFSARRPPEFHGGD